MSDGSRSCVVDHSGSTTHPCNMGREKGQSHGIGGDTDTSPVPYAWDRGGVPDCQQRNWDLG